MWASRLGRVLDGFARIGETRMEQCRTRGSRAEETAMTVRCFRNVIGLGLVLGIAACGALPDRGPRGAGLPYDARLTTGDSWRAFSVVVRAPGADLAAVRESARFAATRHCLERSGFSAVVWAIDPATDDWAVARSPADEPIVTGRCAGR